MRYLQYKITNPETHEEVITKDYAKACSFKEQGWEIETWIYPVEDNRVDKPQKI